jgi:hypothetical protein
MSAVGVFYAPAVKSPRRSLGDMQSRRFFTEVHSILSIAARREPLGYRIQIHNISLEHKR